MSDSAKKRIVFMGTPELAATILRDLIEVPELDIVAVYTRKDAVRGRGSKLVASPVKVVAQQAGIPVETPASLRDEEAQKQLEVYEPDFICVAAYGMILPKAVLDAPKYECLNVHGSLLPRWRGAAPIQRAILAGDEQLGICIMRMEEGLDTGAFCKRYATEAGNKMLPQISEELAHAACECLVEAMDDIVAGQAQWTEQDESLVTYADKLDKRELWLRPDDLCKMAFRKVQASSDAQSAKCKIGKRGVAVIAADYHVCDDGDSEGGACGACQIGIAGAAGQDSAGDASQAGSVSFKGKRLFLHCADGVLEVLRVKPDGKKEMDAVAFAAGLQGVKQGKVSWSEI